MKQKDIALIIVVCFISVIVGVFASQFLLQSTGGNQIEAEKVESISASFNSPDSRYFNNDSINPTQLIRIQINDNEQPFQQPEE